MPVLQSPTDPAQAAIELDASGWVGHETPLTSLRGRVVLVEVFQMLCRGCVANAIPQVQRVCQTLPDVAVVGLHSVFEHHAAQGPQSLRAFLYEYRIGFPVAIDRSDGESIPVTMRAYGLQGTPSTLLFDRAGQLRLHAFGTLSDIALGAYLGALLSEHGPEQAVGAPTETTGQLSR